MGIFKIGFSVLGWAIPILWELCLMIDSLIYGVANQALKAFFTMTELSANIQAYSTELGYIMSRIMVLAGVYALFKLAIMLINYMIDPSKVKDASKTSGGFVKSILIAVVLLIASPTIFEYLGKFQLLIIDNNVIPKLVYGAEEADKEENSISNQADRFVNSVFLLFFNPAENVSCPGSTFCSAYTNVQNGNGKISDLISYASHSQVDYMPIVSGIVGILLIYYFVIFSIELGVRLLKLAVLQVISPIPIIMSIDPSSKNKISNFVKAYSGLYLQVFIRIITMYLAFVILGVITNWSGFDNFLSTGMLLKVNFFIKLLLYIGVFQAAKELPKLIEDAIGVKMGNAPGKSFGTVLKGIIGGGVGLVGGTVAGAVSGGFGGALAGAASGMVSGVNKGMVAKNALDVAQASMGAVKGAYTKGAAVAGAGGFGMYMLGGAQNFFGGQGKDKATLAKFDGDLKAQDKLIEGYNKKIEGFNKDIGVSNDRMASREKVDQLRSGITGSLDQAFRNSDQRRQTLESYMASDAKLQQLQSAMKEAEAAGFYSGSDGINLRQHDLNRINERKAELELNYEAEKKTFSDIQFKNYAENLVHQGEEGYISKPVDAEFAAALEEYNSYVDEKGMSDRHIASYDGVETAKAVNETDEKAIQAQIESYRKQIEEEKSHIQASETEKKAIEQKKKDFEKSDGYVSRNKRNEEPHPKSRKID